MEDTFWWIVGSGIAMSALAAVGAATLLLPEPTLKRWTLPLVAVAAGSLLGGALFHMLPEAVDALGGGVDVFIWTAAGFVTFFALEQLLHWHHCHRMPGEHTRTLGLMVLVADGLHNFLGGLAVAGAFLVDIRVGIMTWLAAAAHEVPQELGDFGVLLHSGWSKGRALLFNVLSALTFLVGGLVTWSLSRTMEVGFLLPFAAGNFIYIAGSDLVPEINRHPEWRVAVLHFAAFGAGLALLLGLRLMFG